MRTEWRHVKYKHGGTNVVGTKVFEYEHIYIVIGHLQLKYFIANLHKLELSFIDALIPQQLTLAPVFALI